jgi:hypothetical protein
MGPQKMISQITRKIKKIVHPLPTGRLPYVNRVTYLEQGNQWYVPTLAGPSTFLKDVAGAEIVRQVLTLLDKLTPDRYMDFLINFYKTGLEKFGDEWFYADINTVLLGLAKALDVQSYLEIGVRRGRSMAMVAAQSPECYIAGFDLWINNYAGMENPGKEFVRAELERVGYKGTVEFFDGNSRVTVPRYFKDYSNNYFDMITVDGDHSLEGARIDLLNVIPRLKIGGILVFDDISNQDHSYLASLWRDLIGADKQFASYSFDEVGFGIAFAIKKF